MLSRRFYSSMLSALSLFLISGKVVLAAEQPLIFTNVPDISETYDIGDTYTLIYTIKNTFPAGSGIDLPLNIQIKNLGDDQYENVLAIDNSGINHCEDFLPEQATCNIYLILTPNTPGTLNRELAIDYQMLQSPLKSRVTAAVTALPIPSTFWTLVGSPSYPFDLLASGNTLYTATFGQGVFSWNGAGWKQIGPAPGNGMVVSLTLDGNILYAADVGDSHPAGAVWQYNSNNETWSELSTTPPSDQSITLATYGGCLYAGGNVRVGSQFDAAVWYWNGTTWQRINSSFNLGLENINAMQEFNGNFYVGSTVVSYLSSPCSASATWTATESPSPFTDNVFSLIDFNETLYAASNPVWAYNGSNSWSQTTNSPTDTFSLSVFNNALYAATQDQLYVMGNDNTWPATGFPLPSTDSNVLAATNSDLYVTSSLGTYRFTGSEWKLAGTPPYPSDNAIDILKQDDVLYVADYDYGVLSYTPIQGWLTVGSNGAIGHAQTLAFNSDNTILYLGSFGGGMWTYDLHGSGSWQAFCGGPTGQDNKFVDLVIDGNELYAAVNPIGNGGVWSYDLTQTGNNCEWVHLGAPLPSGFGTTEDILINNNILYTANDGGQGVWSYDLSLGNSGEWVQLGSCINPTTPGNGWILSLAISGTTLYAANVNDSIGVWSYDLTQTGDNCAWVQLGVSTPSDINDVIIVDSTLYASNANNGVVWSYDLTQSSSGAWQEVANAAPGGSGATQTLFAADNLLYAGTQQLGPGVWVISIPE